MREVYKQAPHPGQTVYTQAIGTQRELRDLRVTAARVGGITVGDGRRSTYVRNHEQLRVPRGHVLIERIAQTPQADVIFDAALHAELEALEQLGRSVDLSVNYREGEERKDELVVWIHGLGCNKSSFKDAWDVDGLKPFSMLAVDLAGFGDSSKPDDWPYSMEAHTASLIELLKQPQYANQRLHIVGHSMGGVPAVLLAEQLQDRVASLTLAEGNLKDSDCGILSRKSASVSEDEFVTETLPGFKTAFSGSSSDGANLWVEQVGKVINPKAFQRSAASLVEYSDEGDLAERVNALSESGVRVQYIHGTESDQWQASGAALTKEFVPGVRIVPISNAGHFMMNDNKSQFYSRFVQSLN